MKKLSLIGLLFSGVALLADSIHLTNQTGSAAYFSMYNPYSREWQGPFCVNPGEKVFADAITYRDMRAYVIDGEGKKHDCYITPSLQQDLIEPYLYDHIVAIVPCEKSCSGFSCQVKKIEQTSFLPNIAQMSCDALPQVIHGTISSKIMREATVAGVSLKERAKKLFQTLNLKERAKKLYNRAIALAKKGGAKSKELLSKANFIGNAVKEADEAQKAFDECREKHCLPEIKKVDKWVLRHGERARLRLGRARREKSRCYGSKCSTEQKRDSKAIGRMVASILALEAILTTVALGAAAAGIYYDDQRMRKVELKRQESEVSARLEEKRKAEESEQRASAELQKLEEERKVSELLEKGRGAVEKRSVSPIYEAPASDSILLPSAPS